MVKTCCKCNEKFNKDDQIVTAMDRKWHPRCFACDKCKQEIGSNSFTVHDDKPVCLECQKAHFMPKCEACEVTIEPKERYLTYEGKAYHPACFTCSRCKNPMPETKKFTIRGSEKLCKTCAKSDK